MRTRFAREVHDQLGSALANWVMRFEVQGSKGTSVRLQLDIAD